ncbi:fucolectin-like [Mercenaria mercenaria]|uniref:fucolectin-like n=1 Tax=Mercenaria mercenaria TaxID=6596 RepID=UPI00234EB9F0|nr:fucolectin-like [Mercenaria mercenaria]
MYLFVQLAVLLICGIKGNDITNVALGKQAYQSSSEYSDEGEADLAVDGSTNQYWSGGSCSHTSKSHGSYWEVDLGDIYVIDSVKLYNRRDSCCDDSLVGTEFYTGMTTTTYRLVAHKPERILTYQFQMSQTIFARWIRVTRNPDTKEPLMLCEVEVMGFKPSFGMFKRVSDATGTGNTLTVTPARTWEQCCYACFTTQDCVAVAMTNFQCSLLDSDAYTVSSGETMYIVN